jgi:hypothetical protein
MGVGGMPNTHLMADPHIRPKADLTRVAFKPWLRLGKVHVDRGGLDLHRNGLVTHDA